MGDKPLAEILQIYRPSLKQDAVRTSYCTGFMDIPVEDTVRGIEKIIKISKIELDMENDILDASAENAGRLRSHIKAKPEWKKLTKEYITSVLGKSYVSDTLKEEGLEKMLGQISLPWWNEEVATLVSDTYNKQRGTLDVTFGKGHSYIAQLVRAGSGHLHTDFPSIIGNLTTEDGLIMCGIRGGHSYPETIMTLPAGSVNFNYKHPLFDTFYKELMEEAGITKDDTKCLGVPRCNIIAKAKDNTITHSTHYVFEARTNLSVQQMLKQHSMAEHRKEHKIVFFILNEPGHVSEFLGEHKYNQKLPADQNILKVLPSSAISLLAFQQSEYPKTTKEYMRVAK